VAERLVQEGHEATVYTTDIGEIEHLWTKGKRRLPPGEEVIREVRVVRFPVRHLPFSPLSYRAIQRLTLNLSRLPLPVTSLLWRLSQYTPWVPSWKRRVNSSDYKVDLVHGVGLLFASLLGEAHSHAHRRGIPFVLTPLTHLGPLEAFYTMPHQMQLLRDSDAIIALTEKERGFLMASGISGEGMHVIGPGIDLEALSQGNSSRFREKHGLERPFVLFLGTLSLDKGALHLLEAMRRLWKEGCDLDLVLAGPPMDHFLERHFSLGPLERPRCHLLGTIPEEEKGDLLAASEMLVLPSRSESFGIVYLEAWAARKPVVGASVGCVPEVITQGQDGYLVPFGDVQAIAEAILALWRDEEERKRLGEGGYSKALRNYSWQVIYNQIKGLYKSLTEG
jgi:glycosyltransferase involved in cell wall biosynthesis